MNRRRIIKRGTIVNYFTVVLICFLLYPLAAHAESSQKPILRGNIEGSFPKLEWAVEMLDEDVLYETGFETGQELPGLDYGKGDKAGGLYGGQSYITNDVYSGKVAYKVEDTYTNGQKVGSPDINGNYKYSTYSRMIFDKRFIPNGSNLSISFYAKATDYATVRSASNSVAAGYGVPSGQVFLKDVKAGDKKAVVSDIQFFKDKLDKNERFYIADRKGEGYERIYPISVDVATNTITLNGTFNESFKKGEDVLKHYVLTPLNLPGRKIESTDWQLYNINGLIADDKHYDILQNGFNLVFSNTARKTLFIDEIKMGYATNTKLLRDGKVVYTGYLSDYEDTEARDTTPPEPVTTNTFNVENNKLYASFVKPKDNGTLYNYELIAVSAEGNEYPSEKLPLTVTSNIEGYSYVIDTNPDTEPDNTVDTKKEKIEIPLTSNQKHFLHIKVIDKHGNSSKTAHFAFQDNKKPSVTVVPDKDIIDGEWNREITLNITGKDNETFIKRIKLPNDKWVEGNKATYTVSVNGQYSFIVEDIAGNQTEQTITINNLDHEAPTFELKANKDLQEKTNLVVLDLLAQDSLSGIKKVKFDNPSDSLKGRNLLKDSHNLAKFREYQGSKVELEQGIHVPEWDTTEAVKVKTKGGTSPVKFYTSAEVPSVPNREYTNTVKIKNIGEEKLLVNNNTSGIANKQIVDVGETKEVITHSVGNGVTHHQMQFRTADNIDVDKELEFIVFEPKAEVGTEPTPYSTNYEDDIVQKVVITENGEYSFTATDKAGNETVQTITIDNIVPEEFELSVGEAEDIRVQLQEKRINTDINLSKDLQIKNYWGLKDWRLNVKATNLTERETGYVLPGSNLFINGNFSIGNQEKLEGEAIEKVLGDGTYRIDKKEGKDVIAARDVNGIYTLDWESKLPFYIAIRPDQIKIPNGKEAVYESTITWDIIQAP